MIVGDRIAQRFELEAEAGEGAMGVVYRARDLTSGRLVALKALRSPGLEALQRFAREADVLAALSHPNVVQYITHGRTPGGEPFLVMEWLEGKNLRDALDERTFSFTEIIDVGIAIASGLAAAHARGIVHRDLKPANVFLVGASASAVKVVDFGVALLRGGGTLTNTGAMLGTPAFMSPEQAAGSHRVDGRSDLYSLGTILFSAITGHMPFEAGEALAILLAVTTQSAPPVSTREPTTPPRLSSLVDALLATAPELRPLDAESVIGRLHEARQEATATGARFPSHRPPPHASWRAQPTPYASTLHATPQSSARTPPTSEALPPTERAPTTPPSRRTVWMAATFGGVVVSAMAATAVYFAIAGGASSKPNASTHELRASDGAAHGPAGPGFAACPAAAFSCEDIELGDRRRVDLERILRLATGAATKMRPGAVAQQIAGNGLTPQGLDMDRGGIVTVNFTFGLSVVLIGNQLRIYSIGEATPKRMPPCSVTEAYARAVAAGLPSSPSASFSFQPDQINFVVGLAPSVTARLDGATCNVVPR